MSETTMPEQWVEGEYVLCVDSYFPVGTSISEGNGFRLGDTVPLSEADAIRLGRGGAIVRLGTPEADTIKKVARGTAPRSVLSDIFRPDDDIEKEISALEAQQTEAEERLKVLRSRQRERRDGEG